jgi:general secretion pathway protein G
METTAMNKDVRWVRFRRAARAATRGVTLVEVLIVVAIMAVISGGVTLVAFPLYKKSKVDAGMVGCRTVKQAAELYQNLEGASDQCPTMVDLVRSKKLDGSRQDDPWNMAYRIDCSEGEIRVYSNGNDRKPGTADDLKDNFTAADIKKVKDLM